MKINSLTDDVFKAILFALQPPNRLALLVSLETGLRINDVLEIPSDVLKRGQRFSIKESKTGKIKRVYLKKPLYDSLLRQAGKFYVFEGRSNSRKHRTRQAVFRDLQKAADKFGVSCHLSPHSARRLYAADEFSKSGGDIKKVKELLNHSSEAVTLLYVLADEVRTKHNL